MRHPWTLELPSLCRHWEAGRELEFFLFVPFGSFPEWHKASPCLRVPEDSAPSAETRVLYSSSWVQRTLTNAYGRVMKTKDMPCRKPNNPSFPAEWKFLMCIFRAALFWGPSVFGESWWFQETAATHSNLSWMTPPWDKAMLRRWQEGDLWKCWCINCLKTVVRGHQGIKVTSPPLDKLENGQQSMLLNRHLSTTEAEHSSQSAIKEIGASREVGGGCREDTSAGNHILHV